jgi:hypothetical protein
MDTRLQSLMDKYWEGNTTLAEEQELKLLLEKSDAPSEEKAFFRDLNLMKTIVQPREKRSSQIYDWRLFSRIAAGICLLLGAVFLFHYQKKQAEKEAFLEVMQALELVNEQMKKGTDSMKSMEEFRHLKLTREILETPN